MEIRREKIKTEKGINDCVRLVQPRTRSLEIVSPIINDFSLYEEAINLSKNEVGQMCNEFPFFINIIYDKAFINKEKIDERSFNSGDDSNTELSVLLDHIEYVEDYQILAYEQKTSNYTELPDERLAAVALDNIRPYSLNDNVTDLISEGINITNAKYLVNDVTLKLIVKLLDRNYKIFKFDINEALRVFSDRPAKIKTEEYVQTSADDNSPLKVTIDVVKKSYWKNKCLQKLNFPGIRKEKQSFPNMKIEGKRALFLFQGLGKHRTGFYELLANQEFLQAFQNIYKDEIYLLNYPTWFEDTRSKGDFLNQVFDDLDINDKELDFLCTSTGCLVARDLIHKLGNKVKQVNSIICVNGPNLGTPVATAAYIVPNILDFLEFFPNPIVQFIAKFGSGFVNEMIGVMDLSSKSENLAIINENYNLLNRTNDYFVGTEFKKEGPIFKNKPSDKLVPVASMIGQFYADADYGYLGEPIIVNLANNTMIVSEEEGGQRHGKQYLNWQLCDFIIQKLKANYPVA